jgi:hypothetical protein
MTINRNDPKFNRYPGTCTECHQRVEAGRGMLERGANGSWEVIHYGQCPLPVEVKAQPAVVNQTVSVKITARKAVSDGLYTVSFEDGSHKTLRLRTQPASASFKPGEQIISVLTGSDNDSDYTRVGNVEVYQDEKSNVPARRPKIWRRHQDRPDLAEAVRVLFQDPAAAGLAYAEQASRCYRCNRTLTVPTSIHAGLGPECASKVAAM